MRRPTSAESPIDIRIPVHSRGHSSIATDRQWRHCSKGSEQALLPVPQNYRGSACSSRTRPRHMNTHQSAHRWPRLQCARADRPSERCLVLSVCAHKALLSALRSKVTATLSRSSQECDRGKEVTASLSQKKKKSSVALLRLLLGRNRSHGFSCTCTATQGEGASEPAASKQEDKKKKTCSGC